MEHESPTIKILLIPEGPSSIFSGSVLHAFSDASQRAYASVIYIVSNFNNLFESNILISKVKVSPLKELTKPCLELMGILLSSSLLKHVLTAFESSLKIDHLYVWSDSQVALAWVYSEKQLPTFTQNRKDEINKNIPLAEFKYVPTGTTPVDFASRGSKHQYIESNLWLSKNNNGESKLRGLSLL